jgi:hypothetical protein
MLKYVSKFALDILPSVVATIIGAYIVNHYIVTRPADAPLAAAASSVDPKKADIKRDAKPSETSSDVANIPEAGVRAKGISEKAILERSAVEKPAEKSQEKSPEKSADKPSETAAIPADTRRHQLAPREKTAAKTAPVPAQPSVAVVVPVVAAPNPAPPVEAAVTPEEHRDANDLARAAIERLRGTSDVAPRTQEAARIPDAPRVPDAPRLVPDASRMDASHVVSAPPVRPLPPPIMVSTPAAETFDSTTGSSQMKPPYTADPRRPTPPADIPYARPPLDLRAEATEPVAREHTTVAEDVLSAAKSVFHAVLPK